MKKLLKSFKQAFLIDEEDSKNQNHVKPQGECSRKSEEPNKTEAGVSIATNPCQSTTESDKHEVAVLTTESPEKVQSDEAKFSLRAQPNIYGRSRNVVDCRLFLGGLPDNITGDELRENFEKYGKVVNVMIPIDKDTNKHKRYGYLEFESQESANACLDERFVNVGGRRVEVKKAWPRGTTKKGEESCNKKETREVEDYEKFTFRFKNQETTIDGSLKSSSTDSEPNMEETQPRYQELFEDYFKAKFFLQNLLGLEKDSNTASNEKINEKQEFSEAEIDKIIRSLCVYSEEKSSEGEEDSEDFFSESDGTDSIVGQPEFDFIEKNENRPRLSSQPGDAVCSVKAGEGIVCDLCKWAPSDNSVESFLSHCETFAHKQRLKERFRKSEIEDQNKTSTQVNTRNVYQKKKFTRQKKPRIIKSQTNKSVPFVNTENPREEKKKFVLNKVITSIEAQTEKCIKCKMCKKTIPHAPNVRVLMTNLSQHLQSKGHLAKISELQSVQKSKNVPEKKVEATVKVSNKETRAFSGKSRARYAQNKNKLSDTTISTKSESSSNATNTSRGLLPKSKSQSQQNILPGTTTKVKFRCLLCNYFCCKPDTLLAHLNSDSHSANDKRTSSKNVTLSSVWNDLTLCSRCGTCLYGCPNSVANHFAKCKVP